MKRDRRSDLAPNNSVDGQLSHYQTWAEETLAEAEAKAAPDNRETKARAERDRDHRERAKEHLLRQVVQLTAIDGALCLDEDLRVFCFGAKFTAATVLPHIDLISFPTLTPKSAAPMAELGNTRHQSAVRFAWSRPDVLVLVVSQDGRCSLMARTEGPDSAVLRVVRGFERAVPPDFVNRLFGSFARSAPDCAIV